MIVLICPECSGTKFKHLYTTEGKEYHECRDCLRVAVITPPKEKEKVDSEDGCLPRFGGFLGGFN